MGKSVVTLRVQITPQLSAVGFFSPALVLEVLSSGAMLGQGFPAHPALYWLLFLFVPQPSGCGGDWIWQNESKLEVLLTSQHC